ncbi:MAG: CBS domain-containing protein [Candidatus Aenigmatarchaeota archaeon]
MFLKIFKKKMKKKKIKAGKKKVKKIRRIVKIKRKLKPGKKKIIVSELMTKNIISVSPYMSLCEVLEIFKEKKISGAPVLDKGFFIGEISKTDILKIINKGSLEEIEDKDREVLKKIIVADVMKKPICIREDKSVEEAKKKMEKYNIKRLLVLDKKGRLVGIITRTDLLKWAPKQEIKETISTKIDEMLKILEEGPIELQKLSKLLSTPENLVENWAKILEEHDIVEINYPAIGSPVVKMKKQE